MLVLRLQLVAYVVTAAALVALGVLLHSLHAGQVANHNEIIGSGRAAALALGRSIAPALAKGDRAFVRREAAEVANGPMIARVVVLDMDGAALAEAVPDAGPAAVAHERGGWAVRALQSLAGSMEVVAAVEDSDGRPVGAVQVTLSDSEMHARLDAAVTAAFRAGAVALGVAAVVSFVLAGRVSTPLGRVERIVRALEKGGCELRAPLRGARRLRPLMRGVNEVAARLGSMSASTSFINNVVQSMVDTLIVVDQQARMKVVNQATLDLLGYAEDELVGRTASLICVADGYHLTAAQLEQLLGQGSKKDHEVTYIAKDGTRIPISLSGSAVKDRSGKTTGYVCIGTDITNRKEAEAEREKLHKQLVATSRQAGMAEVATGVLHNVGNVLNSVNVSASLVEETIRKSKVSKVGQIAELLGQHAGDLGAFMTADERGKVLPQYLGQLSGHLAKEQEMLLEEVRTLSSHIGHIKDIISVQQTISKTAGVIESIEVRELVEDAVRMIAASLDRHHVRLVREYEELPPIATDKHKILQILVNLISNALDAVKEAPDRDGVLTVRVRRAEGAPEGVRIEVHDNGVGIAPENLTRIFTHGFTTKRKGHGFGLHSAALAAKELQGSLTAQSDGPGSGAAFVLTLPFEPTESTRAQAA